MRKSLLRNMAAIFLLAICCEITAAQNTGLQTIGLSSFGGGDLTKTGDLVISAAKKKPGEYEITFLPTTFNPDDPYTNATELVKYVLPKLPAGSRLRMTVYLGFRTWDRMDWDAFIAPRPSRTQQTFLNGFVGKVKSFDSWVSTIRAWATSNKVNDRLGISCCASLEDDCPRSKAGAYSAMLGKMMSQQQQDRVATPLRRCSLDTNIFRATTPGGVKIPLEIHGSWSNVSKAAKNAGVQLGANDCFSNDGLDRTPEVFISDLKSARAAGLNVFYWSVAFNGSPRSTHPSLRGDLYPFTGVNGAAEYQGALRVIQSR